MNDSKEVEEIRQKQYQLEGSVELVWIVVVFLVISEILRYTK